MNHRQGWLHSLSKDLWELVKSFGNWIGKVFDRIIYNNRASLVVSGVFAIIFCVSINYEDLSFQFLSADTTTYNYGSVPVETLMDSENYEVSGLPATADLTVTGDPADIQLVRTQNSASVRADLRSLAEGTNVVALEAVGLPTGVEATVTPSTAEVNLQKKIEKSFLIEPELLVGSNQSASDYSTPVLSTRSVTIKAISSKLESIRTVKAIIDASGKDGDFTVTAPLVAYDSEGKQVNVTITPDSVTATVTLKTDEDTANTADKTDTDTADASDSGSNADSTDSTDSADNTESAENSDEN